MFVNRHELVTLLVLLVVLAVVLDSSLILAAAFFAPTATRELIGDGGILLTTVIWSACMFAAMVFRDRIVAWMRWRRALRDQA